MLCPAQETGEEGLTPLSQLNCSQRAPVLTVLWMEDTTFPQGYGGGLAQGNTLTVIKVPRLKKKKQNPGACLVLPAGQHPAIQGWASCLGVPSRVGTSSIQFTHSVVSDSCDTMNHSTLGLPVDHQLPEFTQTHVHCVHDAIQPSHPLSSPPHSAFNLSQHQGLFK